MSYWAKRKANDMSMKSVIAWKTRVHALSASQLSNKEFKEGKRKKSKK
jgi:hypothetical protein